MDAYESGNIVSSEKDQAEIISHHFCQLLAPDDASTNTIKSYAPCAMITHFNGDEIYEAAKSMKNGKSSGIDDIHAEHIKYAPPPSIHENIAHILNTTAKDGNPPDELKIGILSPLPKPGKKKGPPENLRPISIEKITDTLPHETNLGQIKNKNTLGPSSIPRRQKHNRTHVFP